MTHYARKCIKDSDIDLKRVEKRLRKIAEAISVNNKNNLTDINIICEEIFGKILNNLYDIKNNKLNLYWELGFKEAEKDMECFDNNIKWKADYTAEWIKSKLLDKAHKYWNKYHGKWPF